ncbi:Potassium transporter 4 [Citrus sinensis]|uniref:Potassium transporter 4 n=1 Tax=Citrus sinensis TaxID=2711 RepID=A0ACB8N2D8_CITSI|nr:Potassium transporter 4 [Citrus sinensis]
MEPESGLPPPRNPSQLSWPNLSRNLLLAYQSLGVVYGDLSTSPLYVYSSAFSGRLDEKESEETILGAFSLIFWTLTLIPLLKYIFIVLSADDNGGTFALYSLLCRHAKFSLLPNQQAADEELSTYKYGNAVHAVGSSPFKRFLEKHKKLRTVLLVVVLFGACMVIGDGVLTPAISVLSSVSGLQVTENKLTDGELLILACVILVGLFALQHFGTHKVAVMFAPIIIIWLISIFAVGLYNVIHWNPKVISAISPLYIIKYFRETGKTGWISLGGLLLCITGRYYSIFYVPNSITTEHFWVSSGTEAMFADLGHFTALSIRLAFTFFVYPCLVVQYMGQAAYLSKNLDKIPNSFYDSIPEPVFWPVFVVATLSAIVGSQAIITATFSIVKQCHSLGCFPRVKDTTLIGNAYGLACMTVMFITTFLMALIIIFVWYKSIFLAGAFLLFFLAIEGVYLSAAFIKVPQGGWVPLVLSSVFMVVMYIWHYGTRKKYNFDLHNKVSLRWLLGLGPSLGIVRVPGIGLIYSELATGVPAIFSHFVTNLPAFHKVLVFVCVKSVPVPYVSPEERFLIGRVCPRPYRMYRCIVRYGYKDVQRDDGDFENQLIQSIAEFIQMEAEEPQFSSSESSLDGRMAVISTRNVESNTNLIISVQEEDIGSSSSIQSSKSLTLQSLQSVFDEDNPVRRRQVRFQLPSDPGMDPAVREELMDLIQAKEAGIAYIMGHSYVKARRSSSFVKRFMIDILYSFLRKNCRGPSVALNIPHISLIEVGMIYYV